jgi:16S rRNA (guanine966-N2)-methyltransferase
MGVTDVWRRDATKMGPRRGEAFDLFFLDPPYGLGLGELALASCLADEWIAPGAMVVWEDSKAPIIPEPLEQIDQRKYGDTIVTLARMPRR